MCIQHVEITVIIDLSDSHFGKECQGKEKGTFQMIAVVDSRCPFHSVQAATFVHVS